MPCPRMVCGPPQPRGLGRPAAGLQGEQPLAIEQGEVPEGEGGPWGEPAVAEAAAVPVEDAEHLRGDG